MEEEMLGIFGGTLGALLRFDRATRTFASSGGVVV